MDEQERKEMAMVIIKQLSPMGMGGLVAMVGANLFCIIDEGVVGIRFHFKGCRKYNMVKIVLTAADLYDMTFAQINRKGDYKEGETIEGLYCDMLQGIFEKETGLYLSL